MANSISETEILKWKYCDFHWFSFIFPGQWSVLRWLENYFGCRQTAMPRPAGWRGQWQWAASSLRRQTAMPRPAEWRGQWQWAASSLRRQTAMPRPAGWRGQWQWAASSLRRQTAMPRPVGWRGQWQWAASSLHRQTAMPRSVSLLHAMACHLTFSVPSHHLNQCSKQISSSATFQPLKQSWVQSLAWQVEPNFCCTDLAGIWLPLLKNVYNISYFPVHFILMA